MNKMKKFFLALCALGLAYTAKAQEFEDVNSVYIQYDAVSIDELDLSGIGVGYTHSWGLSSSAPLYLQAGIGFQYAFGSEDDVDYNMYSLGIPVNLGYQFQISDNFGLAPYLGLNVRYYLGGKGEYDFEGYSDDFKLFDSDEADWKAFAFGWQIGVRAVISKVTIGLSYGTDFTEMVEDADKLASFKVTLGYNF